MLMTLPIPGRLSRKTALRVVTWLVVLLLVGPFIIHAMPQVVGAAHSYVVLSDSMSPAINSGDIVIVGSVDPETIEEGDIITFQDSLADEKPTTHRVVEVIESDGELSFRTKGDANENPDEVPVSSDQILGVVVFVVPYLGHVVHFANTIYGFVALVVLPLGLLIVTEIWNLIGATRTPTGKDADHASKVDDDGNSTNSSEHTLTLTDLRLTGGILAAFAVYSGWVAYTELTAWSVSVAVAAAAGCFLVIGVAIFGETTPESE